MSREIKFRGKRLDNGEWVYGCLTRYSKYMSYIMINLMENEVYEVSTETVGQYVEILDAYEGDLLLGYERDEYGTLLSSWVGVIKYNDEKSRIMILEEEQQDWYEVDDYIFDRIVGNIYDNPELLEVD